MKSFSSRCFAISILKCTGSEGLSVPLKRGDNRTLQTGWQITSTISVGEEKADHRYFASETHAAKTEEILKTKLFF